MNVNNHENILRPHFILLFSFFFFFFIFVFAAFFTDGFFSLFLVYRFGDLRVIDVHFRLEDSTLSLIGRGSVIGRMCTVRTVR